eukprot:gene10945-11099_t
MEEIMEHPMYQMYAQDQLHLVAHKMVGSSDSASNEACSADYGEQYIKRWARLKGTYCGGTNQSYSSVTCHAHPEADLSVCKAHNLVLSSKDFMGRKSDSHSLPQPFAGSVKLSCKQLQHPGQFLRGRLNSNEGSRIWLRDAARFDVPELEQRSACSDEALVVQHPVLVIMRVDAENAFHNLEAISTMLAALQVLQLPSEALKAGLEVVVADHHPAGLFLDILRRFSYPHPLRLLAEQPYPDGTCFTTLLLAPYPAHSQSLLTYKGGTASDVLCMSTIMVAVGLWLRHLFRDLLPLTPAWALDTSIQASILHTNNANPVLSKKSSSIDRQHGSRVRDPDSYGHSTIYRTHHRRSINPDAAPGLSGPAAAKGLGLAPLQPTAPQSPSHLHQLHVLWLSRSRFERQRESDLTSWQRARQLPVLQQEELLAQLQRTVLQWNEQTCVEGQTRACSSRNVMFSLQVAELSELSFYPEQISLLMRTGILMGVHGAGLANQVLMPPGRGAVIEVWLRMDDNYHYHNLAHMLGHKYYNIQSEEALDVQQVVGQLQAAMDAVAEAHAVAGRPWWRRTWG